MAALYASVGVRTTGRQNRRQDVKKDPEREALLKKAAEEFDRRAAETKQEEERKEKFYAIVVSVARRNEEGIPVEKSEKQYAEDHLDEKAREALELHAAAKNIVLSPNGNASKLGGHRVLYPASATKEDLDAEMLVSDKHPLGVIAAFDFDLSIGKSNKAAKLLADKLRETLTSLKTHFKDVAPQESAYLPNDESSDDGARWSTFLPKRSSIGVYRKLDKLSIIIKTNASIQALAVVGELLEEDGMTLGKLVKDPRYIRLEELVVRNVRRVAYEVAVKLLGYEEVPFEDDSKSCIQDNHCYYPLAMPSFLVHTNCFRMIRETGEVAVFVDAANRTTVKSKKGTFLVWDGNMHDHAVDYLPTDDSLIYLRGGKIHEEERGLRDQDEQELRGDTIVYASIRAADVHSYRKYKDHGREVVYENIISLKN